MKDDVVQQDFAVRFAYPVYFGRDFLDPANRFLPDHLTAADAEPVPMAVFLDDGLAELQPAVEACLSAWSDRLTRVGPVRVVPGGEAVKDDWAQVTTWLHALLEPPLCRHSFVLVIGGGAVLDAVGFAASLVHRGLRVVRMPTTTLAQNDAGIGVKTGLNLGRDKNAIGTFAPPHAVFNDAALLASLPQAHWIGGVAEAFKVALIKDAAFFDQLCADAAGYAARDAAVTEAMIARCADLHLTHICESGDAFEQGAARPLDFGHWSAHQLERMSRRDGRYAISHGEAVATGIVIDSLYAAGQGWLGQDVVDRLIAALRVTGFALWHAELAERDEAGAAVVLQGLDAFRAHLGGRLCLPFPDGLGRQQEVHQIDRVAMAEAIERLAAKIDSPAVR
jgi:3-dehydroquinate synthase